MPDEPEDDVLLDWMDLDHAAAVGRAVSAWAILEYEMDGLIWELSGLEPEIGACLTAQFTTVSARITALIALVHARQMEPALIDRLNRFRHDANGLAERRNRIVHDPWFHAYHSKRHYRLQKTAKPKLEHAYKHVSIDELESTRERMAGLRERFGQLRFDILGMYHKS